MEKQKILIIDDDPNIRKTLSDILKIKGYEPLTAENGIKGLGLLKQFPVNLVIVDLGLPDINGLEVLSKIKADCPITETIILTGNASLDSAIEATNKGAFSYLLKPYDMDQLMLHIRRAIEKHEAEETIFRHNLELAKINTQLNERNIELAKEITERKQAEQRLGEEINLKNFLLDLFKRAPALADKDLYDHVLNYVVRLTDSAIGFFHLVSDDQKNVILTTWNNEALKNCAASYATHYPIDAAGNWVDCVRLKKPVIYNDFKNSPNRKGLPDGHVPVKRFMSVPVLEGDKVRIIFGVGNKPEDYNELDAGRIQILANDLQRIMAQRQAKEEIITLSITDQLTGLHNRRGFITLSEQQLKIAERTKKNILLFFADLDKMKYINDTFGHHEGDNALYEVAAILKEVFRESDIIGRMGGDEFAVLAIDTTDETGEILINRLHNVLNNYNKPEGRKYHLSLSTGIAHYDPDKPCSLDELIALADTLMYEEKRNKQQ